MNIVVIGAGNVGKIYARIIYENPFLNLVAIVGHKSKRAENLASKYKTKAVYNLRSLISGNSDIDAYILATPEWVRIDPIKEIIGSGKPLLYEKPLASNLKEARDIYDLIQSSNNQIIKMPVFNLRFSVPFTAGYERVSKGAIGNIRCINSRRNGNRNIAKRIINNISPFYWLSPHDMDLLRWFCSTEVEWVRSYHRSFKNLVDGYLLAHIRLKNGIDVQHMVHWSSPELSNLAPQTSFELFGTEGIIKIDEKSTNCQLFREGSFIESADTIYSPVASEEIEGPFRGAVNHFIKCIKNGEKPIVGTDDAFASVKICSAMELSFTDNRKVFLNEI